MTETTGVRGARQTVPRLGAGIEGCDVTAGGGLPVGRTALVGGTAASGKTLSTPSSRVFGELKDGPLVLETRGSAHEHTVREFTIDERGVRLEETFHGTSGILSGNIIHDRADEGVRRGDDDEDPDERD